MKCRICQSETELVLDLGHHPPSDAFLSAEDLKKPEVHYPLTLYRCKECSLFQLGYVVPRETLYDKTYPYETGSNKHGVKHFNELADDTVKRFGLGSNDLVMDIGSNDGTLLKGFQKHGCNACGVEPVQHLAEKALADGIYTFNEFFPGNFWYRDLNPRIITATNVFAHIDDIHKFVATVKRRLLPNGVFIIEAPHITSIIYGNAWDTIYHEHLSYLGLKPLQFLLKQYDMEVFRVKNIDVHAGTTRYYICNKGMYSIDKGVIDGALYIENTITDDVVQKFAEGVRSTRAKLIDLLRHLKSMENRIVGVSAPAKGNTLLNYCKIGTETLDYITDVAPYKIGRVTPGMHIPVVSDGHFIEDSPDYAIILAWNWAEQIMENLKGFKGRWIIPIPEPRVIGHNEQKIEGVCCGAHGLGRKCHSPQASV